MMELIAMSAFFLTFVSLVTLLVLAVYLLLWLRSVGG